MMNDVSNSLDFYCTWYTGKHTNKTACIIIRIVNLSSLPVLHCVLPACRPTFLNLPASLKRAELACCRIIFSRVISVAQESFTGGGFEKRAGREKLIGCSPKRWRQVTNVSCNRRMSRRLKEIWSSWFRGNMGYKPGVHKFSKYLGDTLQILGAGRLTWSKIHIKGPKILEWPVNLTFICWLTLDACQMIHFCCVRRGGNWNWSNFVDTYAPPPL